jgi:hypothetical protein
MTTRMKEFLRNSKFSEIVTEGILEVTFELIIKESVGVFQAQ